MEAAQVNRPPARLERLVLLLTPPAAREAVVGDLCETYRSPSQYRSEALRTVPFVIASQMRRCVNVPALALQGFLIFLILGGFASIAPGPLNGAQAIVLTFLILLVLLIRDTYQARERQPYRHAMGEAILVVFGMLFISIVLTLGMPQQHHDDVLWLQFGFGAPLMFPLLCVIRAGLIVEGDSRPPFQTDELSEDTILHDYCRFARRTLWRNRMEICGLVIFIALALAFHNVYSTYSSIGLGLLSVYAAAVIYLLLEGQAQPLPPKINFLLLRAQYQRELIRQQQLRRFLWWLWFTPVLIGLHAGLIDAGFAAHRPILVAMGVIAAMLLCFSISALNREFGGRVSEKVGLLERLRAKRT